MTKKGPTAVVGAAAAVAEVSPQVAMTPEEFNMETRFVILNFMGLVPASHLGEAVHVGSSWPSASSSSGGSHRSTAHHSRSSSNSSHREILPEFTDEHIQGVTAHGGDGDSLTHVKKPLVKSRSLPRDPDLVDYSQRAAAVPRPSRAALMMQLRKTKSVSTGEPSVSFGGVRGSLEFSDLDPRCEEPAKTVRKQFTPRILQRSDTLDEESEPEDAVPHTYNSSRRGQRGGGLPQDLITDVPQVTLIEPNSGDNRTADSGLTIPAGTPTDQAKLFDITQGLSLSSLDSLVLGDTTPPELIRVPTRDRPQSFSAFERHQRHPETRDPQSGLDESDQPPDVFRFRGRSESPARPMTLDLSDDAPKSPGPPSWKELVRSPEKFARPGNHAEVDLREDCVDSSVTRQRETSPAGQEGEEPQEEERNSTDEASPVARIEADSGDRLEDLEKVENKAEEGKVEESEELPTPARSTSVSAHGESDHSDSSNCQPPHRQSSCVSSGSTSLPSPLSMLGESARSWVSSRTSVTDLHQVDVAALVANNTLPAVALPLKEELSEQFRELEQRYEHAVQSHQVRDILSPTPSTESPESEVARRLGVIGDQVQEEYGEAIEFAINGVMSLPREQISYDVFVAALVRAGLNSTQIGGWKQVALLLLFSQRLTLALLQKGERHLRGLVDLTARAVNDYAAGFILDQGGWSALSELDLDSPVSVSDIATHLTDDGRTTTLGDISETDGGSLLTPTPLSPPSSSAADTPTDRSTSTDRATNTDPTMSTSPSDENSNKFSKRVVNPPSPTAVSHNGADRLAPNSAASHNASNSRSGQLTPEEMKSIEDAVSSVRHEIQLIRQVSSDLHSELEYNNRPDPNHNRPVWYQVAALGLLATTIGVAIFVLARHRSNR